MPDILIIGGGLAGMAAAAALVSGGNRVTLLESRPRLGGRASSFVDQTTGTTIDNCQHVNLGCCTNFRHFCDVTGISDSLRTEPSMTFIGTNRRGPDLYFRLFPNSILAPLQPSFRTHLLCASPLPAPLHLLPSFARLSYLTWYDKWRLAWGLKALAHRKIAGSNEIMSDWLRRHRQTPNTIQRVWQVVLVSALSESLDRIAVKDARKVFVDAFLANRHGWELQIPTAPLDTLYTQRVATWLRGQGTDVRPLAGVSRICMENDRATGVELRDGRILLADEIILAVPSFSVAALLPEHVAALPVIQGLKELEWAPISSVHLWFDRPIMPLPHATLVDRLSQWVFDREVADAPGGEVANYYQVVISASRELEGREQSDIIRDVVNELTEIWPMAQGARLINGRVVTEHKACLSMLPQNESLRPGSQSPIANVSFAGDWTATGWPSTMEGAVRSGYLAAENVAQHLGQPKRFVQPDLPVSWLARVLLGI
ncbi:MAG: pds [Planctomycetaceae bacterium]|nr:pds [Planctomycetaceae bacterium]